MKLAHPLRTWQKVALDRWLATDRCGVVRVVTGGGKTLFAHACFARARADLPSLRSLILVPSVALMDQWLVSLELDLNLAPGEIAAFGGGRARNAPRMVNVAVINSARQLAPKLTQSGDWMLIVDECHRAASPKNLAALTGRHVATLGLSATPERQYDEHFETRVVPVLGKVIYDYGIADARRDGVIAPFHLINVQVSLLSDEAEQYARLSRQIGRLHRKVGEDGDGHDKLEAALRARARVYNNATMRIPVAVRLLDRHRGTRTIVFHEDIASANAIADAASEREHSITRYHTRIAPALRKSNLHLYRKGIFDAIVSCRALDEGVDVPETEIAIIASGSATRRQRIQRLGRALRRSPGKDAATIYTIFATDVERERLAAEAASLSDVASVRWLRVDVDRGAHRSGGRGVRGKERGGPMGE